MDKVALCDKITFKLKLGRLLYLVFIYAKYAHAGQQGAEQTEQSNMLGNQQSDYRVSVNIEFKAGGGVVDTIEIGDRILELRTKLNLSRKELSEKSGVSESAIKQYETKKREPRIEQLLLLSTALETNISYLIDEQKVKG